MTHHQQRDGLDQGKSKSLDQGNSGTVFVSGQACWFGLAWQKKKTSVEAGIDAPPPDLSGGELKMLESELLSKSTSDTQPYIYLATGISVLHRGTNERAYQVCRRQFKDAAMDIRMTDAHDAVRDECRTPCTFTADG
eukprot:1159667-Pelagomonas_calceolata.AAC.6